MNDWREVIAAILFVLLFGWFIGQADASKTWTGYILSWPSSGRGLIMGWAQDGFSDRKQCIKWLVDRREQAGKLYTVTHDVTGGCI